MQQTRLSWTLTALVLASAVLISLATETALIASSNNTVTAISSASSDVCAATTCRLTSGETCNRTVSGCPVCVEFQAATNEYTCTTVVKTTMMCPLSYSTCENTPVVNPSSSSPSAGSLAGPWTVRMASNLSDNLSSRSDSGDLGVATMRAKEPEKTVTATSSEKSASLPVWIIIAAGIVVACILAAVGCTMYARRRRSAQHKHKQDTNFVTGHSDSGSKEFDLMFAGRGSHESRRTSGTESALATPATPQANYAATDRSTAAEGAVFQKSDSWSITNASSPSTIAFPHGTTMAARTAALGPPPVVQPQHRNSFQGSHHVNTMFIDDLMDPLDVSQLTTEVSRSVRESDNAFHIDSPHSEWMASTLYDDSDGEGFLSSIDTDLHDSKISMLGDDGSNASGTTDFYASAITVLGDDDDDFPQRKSERVEAESVTKWKQKFYVEL